MNLLREFELFDAAIELRSPEERTSFLDAQCGGDDELKNRVLELVAAHEKQPAPKPSLGLREGMTVDDFALVRRIAQGGMGVVFEANQEKPRRRVALKVLRAELATEKLLARFEQETEAVGRLSHPGIAAVHAAGTVEVDGIKRPYFAMEFVDGVPLTDWAEQHSLDDDTKLELLARTCEVVQHAHDSGVLHRDLKPDNILVDETGQPRVLDFGLARVSEQTTNVAITRTGDVFGTLPYMSPEQIGGSTAVNERTDVYALGVIGYNLLAGHLPLDVRDRSLVDAARVIERDEPTRLGTLQRRWRGDIQAIVQTAMAKNASRRYESAAALAADLRRYLRQEPVHARPPSAIYHFSRFAVRHRAVVGGAAIGAIALVSALILAMFSLGQVMDERDKLAEVSRVFRDILSTSDPTESVGPNYTVRQALDRAAQLVAVELDEQPDVRSAVDETIGAAYLGLGLLPEARTHLERAGQHEPRVSVVTQLGRLALFDGELPRSIELLQSAIADSTDSFERAEARRLLAAALEEAGRLDGAIAQLDQAGSDYQRIGKQVGAANAGMAKSMIQQMQGRFADAERTARASLAMLSIADGVHAVDIADAEGALGRVLAAAGKLDEALPIVEAACQVTVERLGTDHSETATTLLNTALLLARGGRHGEAEQMLRQAVEIYERVLGEDDRTTAAGYAELGKQVLKRGAHEEAQRLLHAALDIWDGDGEEHPRVPTARIRLAQSLAATGDAVRAEQLCTTALGELARSRGMQSNAYARAILDAGRVALAAGNLPLAEQRTAAAVPLLRDGDDAGLSTALSNLGVLRHRQNNSAGAEPPLREARTVFERLGDTSSPSYEAAIGHLSAVLANLDRHAEAAPLLAEHLELRWSRRKDSPASVASWRTKLGKFWFEAKNEAAAAEQFELAFEALRNAEGVDAANKSQAGGGLRWMIKNAKDRQVRTRARAVLGTRDG